MSGDTHHYFMEVATDSNSVLDSYDAEGRTFEKHWSSLLDTSLYMERNYLDWRNRQRNGPFDPQNPDNIKRYAASFMGLWSVRPLLDQHLQNAASVAVDAGFVHWTPEAHALLDQEFEFSQSVNVTKRALRRAATDFDGWDASSLMDMRRSVERVRHDDHMRQIAAIQRIHAQIGCGLITADAIQAKIGPMTSQKEVKKARKLIADRAKRDRGVIKRSARFLTKLIGAETTRLYVGGEAIRIEGRHAIFELKKRSNLMTAGGGWAAMAVFHKDFPDLHLCDICIYTNDVPLLDHIASIVMHIQAGHEEDILSIGNAANCSETAYTLEWLVPHLPSRGTRAIDLDNIVVSQPRWAVPGVTDKKRKTERILRELRRYAYEEVLQEHQPLLSNMRAVTQGSFYLADYSVADHGDAVPLRAPTADVQGDAALVVQEGLDALDEILNQMPQPRDMDHARLIEQALEQVLEADTEWVDPISY